MDTKGGGGMNWEIGVDTYKLSICCIKQIINENLLYSTGNPTQCSCELNGGGESGKEGIYS